MSSEFLFDLPQQWPGGVGPIEKAARDDLEAATVPELTRVLALSLAHAIDRGMTSPRGVSVATTQLVKTLVELLADLELAAPTPTEGAGDNVVSILQKIANGQQ